MSPEAWSWVAVGFMTILSFGIVLILEALLCGGWFCLNP